LIFSSESSSKFGILFTVLFIFDKHFNASSFVLFILLGVAIGFVSVVCFYKNKKFYGAVFALSLLSLILGLIFIKIDMDSRIFSEGNGQFLGYVYEINSESRN